MEITCARCHQAVLDNTCYCPNCGLPQLVYSAEGLSGPGQAERGAEPVRDAGTVDWKTAVRAAAIFALPAGLLSSARSPLSVFGLVWMAGAATWAVSLYMRAQRPAWITIGAGARIGLVTGLLGAWLAFGASGGELFVERFVLHQAAELDESYKTLVLGKFEEGAQQSLAGMSPADAAQLKAQLSQIEAMIASPEGKGGILAVGLAMNSLLLLSFSVAGGALGARFLGRMRQPEI
jgi:hypothetical protein